MRDQYESFYPWFHPPLIGSRFVAGAARVGSACPFVLYWFVSWLNSGRVRATKIGRAIVSPWLRRGILHVRGLVAVLTRSF